MQQAVEDTEQSLLLGDQDDSPYLSIADFFSLLSLTLIFATVVLAPSPSVPENFVSVISGRVSTGGQGTRADPNAAYLSLVRMYGDQAELRMIRPGERVPEVLDLSFADANSLAISRWIESELYGEMPGRIVFYVYGTDTARDSAMVVFGLVRELQRKYSIGIVVLEDEML